MALNSFSATPENIQAAKVFDEKGQEIGTVYQVKTDERGKPTSLNIKLENGEVIAVTAANASYEAASNVIVARTEAAIEQPPPRITTP